MSNWRELWSNRQKLTRRDTKQQIENWVEKAQVNYIEQILIAEHPKDGWVAFLPPSPKKKFYMVIASFDMSQNSEIEFKTFEKLENAEKFAEECKQDFIGMIPYNGALDESESYEYDFGLYFYGVSRSGEDICSVEIKDIGFSDTEYEG